MYMYVYILYFSTDLGQDLKYGMNVYMDALMYVCMYVCIYINHVQDILQEFTYMYCMYA